MVAVVSSLLISIVFHLIKSLIVFDSFSGCLKDTDPGPEGSQMSRTRKHPKENDIKMEFMSRNYQRDKDGRFHQAITEQPQAQTATYEKK